MHDFQLSSRQADNKLAGKSLSHMQTLVYVINLYISHFENSLDSDQLDRQQADQVPYCFPLVEDQNIQHNISHSPIISLTDSVQELIIIVAAQYRGLNPKPHVRNVYHIFKLTVFSC